MSGNWMYDPERPDCWTWLQAWFTARCDGEWEHREPITIKTRNSRAALGEPGWVVEVTLEGTEVAGRPYKKHEVHRDEDDWCVTWVEGGRFHAECGPMNLSEAIRAFRRWVHGLPQTTY